jgi:hypothetical protein
MVGNPSLLSGYYDGYVSQVSEKYGSATLTVDTRVVGAVPRPGFPRLAHAKPRVRSG